MHPARQANTARHRNLLQTGGDINAVTEDIVAFDDDVAKVDANSQGDPSIVGHAGGPCGNCRLHLDGAAHGIYNTGNSSSKPSPVVFTMRPPCSVIWDLNRPGFAGGCLV